MTVHTTYPQSVTFTLRLSGEEAEEIRHAADLLGSSRSSFMREAATTHASEVLKDPEAFVLARLRHRIKNR